MMERQDVDKLLLIASSIRDLVEIGEDVMEDGKVDFADLAHASRILPVVQKIYEAVKAGEELVEEAKDIDSEEAVEILRALLGK